MAFSWQKMRAVAELLLATLFWGFGFVAAIWALRCMGPLTLTAIRFLGAFAVTACLALFVPAWRKLWTWSLFRQACIPGLAIGITLIFQTWGLQLTTASRSGFITGLYVVFVPLLERYGFKKPLHPLHFLFVGVALLGTALIVNLHGGEWSWGDALTLICSVCAAVQISWVGRISASIKSPLTFNALQSVWAGGLALILALFFEASPQWPHEPEPWWGLLSLTFGSTLLAFALQIKSQKIVSASLASLLFLLESPLALIFGVLCLSEQLSPTQLLGAGLILFASLLAIQIETRRLASSASRRMVSSS